MKGSENMHCESASIIKDEKIIPIHSSIDHNRASAKLMLITNVSKSHKFYSKRQIGKIKSRLAWIRRHYGESIRQASRLTQVPEDLISSFIFIESGGNKKSHNKKSGATGLMQLTEGACSDIIYLKNKKGRLTHDQKAILRSVIGERLDCILSMQFMGQKRRCNGQAGYNISMDDLYNPEFNILCGAIYLSILIDKHTENGRLRMDKIITKYNVGLYAKIRGNTPDEVIHNSNKETQKFIKKMVGRNGLLELISA